MLTPQRDTGLAITRYNDVIDEPGERGDAADEEGNHGAPVAGESGRVAVHAVEVVHVWYRHVATTDDVVAVPRDERVSEYIRGRWGTVRDSGEQTRS